VGALGVASGVRAEETTTPPPAPIPGPGLAEELKNVEREQEVGLEMPAVLVIGDSERLRRLPGSGARIDAADIREHSRDDIHEILRRVPGVYVRPEDGNGLFANISLRGVDTARMSKLTVLEDGVPAVPAPYSAPEAYYSPTAGRMSAIEVLKGSSQIRFGPHTTGGVINYLSTPVPSEHSGYLKVLVGSFGEIRVHGWYGGVFEGEAGRFGYLVEGYRRESDGFKTIDRTPDFRDRNSTGFTKTEPMAKFFFEPGQDGRHRIEVKWGSTDLDADETYLGLTEKDFDEDPYRRYAASRFDNIQTEQERFHVRHLMKPSDDLDITTTWYYGTFSRDWFKLNDVRTTGGTRVTMSRALAEGGEALDIIKGRAAGELRVRHNSRDYYLRGLESVARYRFKTGDAAHELTGGVRVHEDQIDRLQWDENFTQAANGAITGSTSTPLGSAGDITETTRATAAFLQDEITFGDWIVTPGLRYERIHLRYDDGAAPATNGRETMGLTAAGVGATRTLDDRWTLFGGVFQGFSPPGPSAAIPDDLEEERSLGFEFGARYRTMNRAFQAEAVLFQTNFDDLIVVDNIGGTGTGVSENAGSVTTRGLELSMAYDPGTDLEWSFRNPWRLAATVTRARLDGDSNSTNAESIFAGGKDGNRVPYIPTYAISVGTGFEKGRFGAYVDGFYVSDVYTTASNTSRQQTPTGTPDSRFGEIGKHVIWNLAVRYDLTETVTVTAGIHNFLDNEYMVSRHPHGPRPGQPRFGYLALEINF
jgi:Fe(3+) dicitrate transport protein